MKRIVGVLGLVCACAAPVPQSRPLQTPLVAGSEQAARLAKVPPLAERAAIRLLDKETATANAILFVQFAAARPAPRTVQIAVDGQSTATLRDDGVVPDERAGDGVHSAYLRVDVQQLEERQERMLRAKSLPVFVGRELVGLATASLSTTPLALKDLPAIPNRTTFQRSKPLALALKFAPVRAGTLLPVYPFVDRLGVADPYRSLLITDSSVVNDWARTKNACEIRVGIPEGKWTFAHLMGELAKDAGIPTPQFVETWLDTWRNDQTVNGLTVAKRGNIGRIIGAWPRVGSDLSLSAAPFRLVAIVNRIDLGENRAYGGGGAGEARFIFALTDFATCEPLAPAFLVIFEYKVPRSGCEAVRAWAEQWKNLETFALFSENYKQALEAITVQFTEAGTNPSQEPNHSSLAQIRTNEVALDVPWELREFRLGTDGYLVQDTVAQTPALVFNNSLILSDYILAVGSPILDDDYTVPKTLTGLPFRGGAAPLKGNNAGAATVPVFFWDGPGPASSSQLTFKAGLRHHFSLNTCNGCHGQETGTIFTHVSESGVLSGFLTGIDVTDPADGTKRSFNDLQLRERRMAEIAKTPCWGDIFFDPSRNAH